MEMLLISSNLEKKYREMISWKKFCQRALNIFIILISVFQLDGIFLSEVTFKLAALFSGLPSILRFNFSIYF